MTDLPNSVHYRRYANVARKLAKQQEGSNGFMWGQLAVLWNRVADRKAGKLSTKRVSTAFIAQQPASRRSFEQWLDQGTLVKGSAPASARSDSN